MKSQNFSKTFFSVASGASSKYLSATYESGKLTISTLEEFKKYELQETELQMTLELTFNCVGETKRLTFYQNIAVVNNYDPEFSQSSYEIVIPTPLPKGLDITLFMVV